MLTSVVRDEELLKQLVSLFFDPATIENAAVTQALSYFLPVFCHSKRENMELMSVIAAGVIHTQVNLANEMDEEEESIGINIVGNMLVDWTDARKLVIQDTAAVSWNEAGEKEAKAVNGDVHLALAESLLERVISHGCSSRFPRVASLSCADNCLIGEERKAILTVLGKLYITSNSSVDKLQATTDLAAEAVNAKIAPDATSRNSLSKLHHALTRACGEVDSIRPNVEEQVADQTAAGNVAEDDEKSEFEETKTEVEEDRAVPRSQDTLLEDLLDDQDEDLSTCTMD